MVTPLFIENACRRDRATLYAVRAHRFQEVGAYAALGGAAEQGKHMMRLLVAGYVIL